MYKIIKSVARNRSFVYCSILGEELVVKHIREQFQQFFLHALMTKKFIKFLLL